ncbi:MAG: hypothetical protein OXF06_13745 [Bacteroidetes bacterium]|nr:hypothetical protein [Bacteroidota bacterium]
MHDAENRLNELMRTIRWCSRLALHPLLPAPDKYLEQAASHHTLLMFPLRHKTHIDT